MPRRKPASAKQRKAELQFKRAVKRGDIVPPTEQSSKRKHTNRTPGGGRANVPIGNRAAQLESHFTKLDKDWLEHARFVASTTVLLRPIPLESTVLDTSNLSGGGVDSNALVAPRRPKWRYEHSKKEVEANEEGVFSKWLKDTDALVEQWQTVQSDPMSGDHEQKSDEQHKFNRSPTYFERNLEVWRQLWRVTEISQILLVLLDSRAPLLHFPPSMKRYLQGINPSPQLILVLTKVDLVGPERASAWAAYLSAQNPGARIVKVESYKEREVLNDGRGSKRFVDPYIPPEFLRNLVSALKEAHAELVNPPQLIAEDPEKLKRWKPRARPKIIWDALLNMPSSPDYLPTEFSVSRDTDNEEQDLYVTVGLIGQPNVGKSSLLNALFGTQKVRASRTPGKTKHFQTLFWTPEIRLVDCPGLVFPSFVPMEMQILAGILPISQMPSMASCIQFASERMPLERIFGLEHPEAHAKKIEDKRTWRVVMEQSTETPNCVTWTAMDIMTAYATQKGWLTAKAGRPDVNRAGNAILRTCADGRTVQWGFWPPGSHGSITDAKTGNGIWIPSAKDVSEEWDSENSEDESVHVSDEETDVTGTVSESSGEDPVMIAGGRFGALALMDYGK